MYKNKMYYFFIFFLLFFTSTIHAQESCNITVTAIDYGKVIIPQSISGACKPQNTLDIGLVYSEGMSNYIKINDTTFPATGSPQTIEFVGTPEKIVVELIGTSCHTTEHTSLDDLPAAPAIMEGDTTWCIGETPERIVLSGHPNTSFYWTNKDGTCIQSLTFSGMYNEEWIHPHIGSFRVYQYVDGKISKPLLINIREGLSVEIIGELFFCQNESTTLQAKVNGQNITSDYSIIWNTPIGSVNEIYNITADIEYFYTAQVTDNNGCLGMATVLVEQINTPQFKIITPQSSIFHNDLKVAAFGSACVGGCDYIWRTPEGTILNTQIIESPNAGTYNITITGKSGCTVSKNIIVE